LNALRSAPNTCIPLIPVPHPTKTATASLEESYKTSKELSNNFQLLNKTDFFYFFYFFDLSMSASANGNA